MAMLWEKIVVTAKEYLGDKNINDSSVFNEILFQTKLVEFDWDLQFSAASVFCEIIWKKAIGRESVSEYRRLDRLFSPSPVSTHANFRGCQSYKTGNMPEKGSIAVWRRGLSLQGSMGIVSNVRNGDFSFDLIEGRVLTGSDRQFIQVIESPGKKIGLPFKQDLLNLVGFIYPPNREIA